jgi:hypothetical protein
MIIDTLNLDAGLVQHGQGDRLLGTAQVCSLRETTGGLNVANA